MKSKTKFRHDSLLDRRATQEVLVAIAKAVKKGQLEFEDSEGNLVLAPGKLLQVSVSASEEGDKQQVDVKLKWRMKAREISETPPDIK